MPDGKYLPLDSSDIIFSASDGRFSGDNLGIAPDFKKDKITIKAVLRNDHSMYKEFTMYIKKKPNDENLKTMDELMQEIDRSKKPGKRKS